MTSVWILKKPIWNTRTKKWMVGWLGTRTHAVAMSFCNAPTDTLSEWVFGDWVVSPFWEAIERRN